MPTKYPKGSYLTNGHARRKVLEELGDLRFLSYLEDDGYSNWKEIPDGFATGIAELERDGWVEESASQEAEDERKKREEKILEFRKWLEDMDEIHDRVSIVDKVRELFLK